MINGDIYKFDLENRYPASLGYIVSETTVNDMTVFVVINGIINGRHKSLNRDQAIYSTAPYTQKMKKNLQDFRKEDYLLAVGDPVIIGISTAAVSEVTNGQFNMLKWDKREYRYYPLEVDMYQKG